MATAGFFFGGFPGPCSTVQQHFAVALFDLENFHALVRLTPLPRREVEFMGVQRADDFAAARQAFGEQALLMRPAVFRGEKMAVALAEDGNFFAAAEVAAALAGGNFFDAAEIDGGGAHGNQPLFSAVASACADRAR